MSSSFPHMLSWSNEILWSEAFFLDEILKFDRLTGVNILANKWMSHPGKNFCVGEKLLSALVVMMILLKISRLGKSWKVILSKINSLGKFCKINSSQKFPVPEKSAKVIPSKLSWLGKYYLASKEIHFGIFSSLFKKMCTCADSNYSQNILTGKFFTKL